MPIGSCSPPNYGSHGGGIGVGIWEITSLGSVPPLDVHRQSSSSRADSQSLVGSVGSTKLKPTAVVETDNHGAQLDDDSISTRSAMRLMWEEMKKINKRMDQVVTKSTLTRQLDQKLEGTTKDIMGKVHQVVNNSTNSLKTKLETLESNQDLLTTDNEQQD